MHALLLLCTCGPLTAEEALSRADAAFEGTVLDTAPQEAPARKECPRPVDPAPAATPAPAAGGKRKGGCLEGSVRSARTCAPLVGAAVVAEAEDGTKASGVSDRNGRYQLCELAGGAYRVQASYDFGREEASVQVADGASRLQHFVLEMSPTEKARLRVERAFKGIEEGTPEVAVITDKNTAACGFGSFVRGERYLVFATRQRGNYYTGLCDGTRLASQAKPELKALGGRRKGGCAGCAAARGSPGAGATAVVAVVVAMGTAWWAYRRSLRSARAGGRSADPAHGRRPRSERSGRRGG